MLVKICGIRTVDQALAAVAAGADLLGLVFAPSRRRITPDDALPIVAAVRAAARPVQLVGLFVNEAPAEVTRISTLLALDMVQFSGDEAPQPADWTRPVLKSVRLQDDAVEAAWRAQMTAAARIRPAAARLPACTALIDAHVAGSYGGTGAQADWQRAAAWARELPIMLAGGLNPQNVAAAIRIVRPAGVDVSSGVERDGNKDAGLMRAFVQAAREAAADG